MEFLKLHNYDINAQIAPTHPLYFSAMWLRVTGLEGS